MCVCVFVCKKKKLLAYKCASKYGNMINFYNNNDIHKRIYFPRT